MAVLHDGETIGAALLEFLGRAIESPPTPAVFWGEPREGFDPLTIELHLDYEVFGQETPLYSFSIRDAVMDDVSTFLRDGDLKDPPLAQRVEQLRDALRSLATELDDALETARTGGRS